MPITTSTSSALGYSAAALAAVALVLFIVTLAIWPRQQMQQPAGRVQAKRATAVHVSIAGGVLAVIALVLFIVCIVLTSGMKSSNKTPLPSGSSASGSGGASTNANSASSSTIPNILPVLAAAGTGIKNSATRNHSQLPSLAVPAHPLLDSPHPDKLSWRDQSPASPGGLEAIVEFDEQDAPARIHDSPVTLRDAHVPKAVPARPRQTPRFYQPAFETAAPPVQFTPNSLSDSHAQAPIYYAPPQTQPTLNDLMLERAQFENRPDTLELQRHRRMTELRDAAASLDPTVQRDGCIVPIC